MLQIGRHPTDSICVPVPRRCHPIKHAETGKLPEVYAIATVVAKGNGHHLEVN
eukprot:m.128910 g.128910  ORF g.128910 m.128910 type:complete len:53 (-) comp13649_c0_seq1:5505-5663(-)